MQNAIKTVGRRKSSVALVSLTSGTGNIIINGVDFSHYLQNNPKLLKNIQSPMIILGLERNYDLSVLTRGGGLNGQSDAIKLGISRALYEIVESDAKKKLRLSGFLTRDSRCKERRKYGLKKARKAPQFSKR